MNLPLPPAPPLLPPKVDAAPGGSQGRTPLEGRDPKGRFAPGNAGKPRGARGRIAAEVDRLLEEGAPEAFRTILGAARCGDVRAAMWILDPVAPARKGRAIELPDFPEVQGVADIAPALAALASSVADCSLSAGEATLMTNVLQRFLEALETAHRLRSGLLPPHLDRKCP